MGCRPAGETPREAVAQPETRERLAQQEAELDATLWKPEVIALHHEKAFVQLRDELIRATNKLSVLAAFPFSEIVVPRPTGSPELLGLGIRFQEFEAAPSTRLNQIQWSQTLSELGKRGWSVEQGEWNHDRFTPATAETPANSQFSFELHGQRNANRFILRGTLEVTWVRGTNDAQLPEPRQLFVSDLRVLERGGAPGFSRHAVVTPDPPTDRFGVINMTPILVADLDDSGSEDIVMAGVNRLFLNDGQAGFSSGEFIEEPFFHGVKGVGLLADFNGDTLTDFLTVGSEGSWTNRLLLYLGQGSIPLSGEPLSPCPSIEFRSPQGLTAGDVDGDGDLDVWLGQYKPPYVDGQLPTPYYDARDGYPSFLLRNMGGGKFEDVTVLAGLGGEKRFRRNYGASLADLDEDGDLDLITINDFCGVDLHYNQGLGQFRDETDRLYNRHLFGMSHQLADFDGDGLVDLLAIGMNLPSVRRLEHLGLGRSEFPERTARRADMAYGNRLYLRRGDRWIQPDTADQLAESGWTWGCAVMDFDNDSYPDVYLVNGHISGESSADYDSHYWRHDIYIGSSTPNRELLYYFDEPFRGINTGKASYDGYQHNVFFWNLRGEGFVNIAYLMDLAHETDCRALVSADLNRDGRMDVILTEMEWLGTPDRARTPLRIHLNNLDTGHHWIAVRLKDGPGGRSAIGAKVTAQIGERRFVGQVALGTSYLCQHPNTVHFGLGSNQVVDQLTIQWPNGEEQTVRDPAIDQYHVF